MGKPVIFIAGQDPIRGRSGHPSYVRAHARAATHAGFEPHIFCMSSPAGIAETDYGVIHRIELPFPRRLTQSSGMGMRISMIGFDTPRLAREIETFIRRHPGPHLIHGFGQWGYPGVIVGRKMRREGVKVATINSIYGTYLHACEGKMSGLSQAHSRLQHLFFKGEWWWIKNVVHELEAQAYRDSQVVTHNYEAVARLYRREFGDRPNVKRIPYASEAAFLYRDEMGQLPRPEILAGLEPADAPLIVSVSRHDARKGVDVLIRALGLVKRAGIPFRACITSGGPLWNQHRHLAQSLDLDRTTILTGWTPDSYPYMQQADIFVLPSIRESSGSLAMLEAMQLGAAVIASNVDGIPEDITEGRDGLLFEPGNAEQLSQAIIRLLHDRDLRLRLSQGARETFAHRFSAEAFTDAIRDLYGELGFLP